MKVSLNIDDILYLNLIPISQSEFELIFSQFHKVFTNMLSPLRRLAPPLQKTNYPSEQAEWNKTHPSYNIGSKQSKTCRLQWWIKDFPGGPPTPKVGVLTY